MHKMLGGLGWKNVRAEELATYYNYFYKKVLKNILVFSTLKKTILSILTPHFILYM